VRVLRPLPDHLAGVGVLLLGVMWSLGAGLAEWDQLRTAELPMPTALLLVTVGGTLTVAGVWLGVSAVAWAMGRLLGGKARFTKMLFAVSAAAPPLWVGAPMGALAWAEDVPQSVQIMLTLIAGSAALGFLILLVSEWREVETWSSSRAWSWVALTTVFCASFLSLHSTPL
jgi:hypothetical protein